MGTGTWGMRNKIIGSVLLTVFRNKWNTNKDANIIKLGIIAKMDSKKSAKGLVPGIHEDPTIEQW